MTDRSERIKQAHIGSRMAATASDSRLFAMQRAGLSYERTDDFSVIVERQFIYWPATGYWRDLNDDDKCGYTVPALKQEIMLRRNRGAAAVAIAVGLEEIAPPVAPSAGDARCAPDETSPGQHAGMDSGARGEAAAEPSDAYGSRNLLPVVAP